MRGWMGGAVVAAAVVWVAPAAAQSSVSGTWSCCGSGGAAAQNFVITENGGTLTGVAKLPSGTEFASISGTRSGSAVTIITTYYSSFASGYIGTMNGTLSADGTTIAGSWSSNSGQSGTFTATRSGPAPAPTPTTPAPTTPAPTTPAPPGAARRGTFVDVTCDRGPGPNDAARCTAVVADTGAPTRATPTGIVQWSATSGSLTSGQECMLAATPLSPGVASCRVDYQPAAGVGAGVAFPVTARYVGSATHAPSAGQHSMRWASCVSLGGRNCSGDVALAFPGGQPVLRGNSLGVQATCLGQPGQTPAPGSTAGASDPTACQVDVSTAVTTASLVPSIRAQGKAAAVTRAYLALDGPGMGGGYVEGPGMGGGYLDGPGMGGGYGKVRGLLFGNASKSAQARRAARPPLVLGTRRVRIAPGGAVVTTVVLNRDGRFLAKVLRKAGVRRMPLQVRVNAAARGDRRAATASRQVVTRLR